MLVRAVQIPCGEIVLEGELVLPGAGATAAGVVVCHPHPQMGGDMDNHVVDIVVRALAKRGIASLRFNFRGAGRSGGSFDGGRGEQEDVRAAVAWFGRQPKVDAARVGLAGYSFGAAMASLAAEAAPRGLALVSFPSGLGERSGGRSAAEVLGGYPGPVLLVTGDEDRFVQVEPQRALAAELGERAELVVVPGVDHFWMQGIPELATAVGEFFARALA